MASRTIQHAGPRRGERVIRHDFGLWLTMIFALFALIGGFSYCVTLPAA
jgi:hypothetical protein